MFWDKVKNIFFAGNRNKCVTLHCKNRTIFSLNKPLKSLQCLDNLLQILFVNIVEGCDGVAVDIQNGRNLATIRKHGDNDFGF